MKKRFLSVCVMAGLVLLQLGLNYAVAGNIDLKKAKTVAAYYMGVQSGQKSLTAEDMTLVYEIDNATLSIPALYFFNTSNGGFIIISGSDCMDPVIGYSTEGVLDPNNMPPAMLWFVGNHARFIIQAQNTKMTPSDAIKATWDEVLNQTITLPKDGSKYIYKTMRSIWDQSYPYNAQVPTINGTHCPTGCVATAMAQIIKYWEYPVVGQRSLTYEWNNGQEEVQELTADFANTVYRYDLMFDTATSSVTQEQIDAVAELNYHCGVANRMNYGLDGSGAAASSTTVRAFWNYFKYDRASMQWISRTDFSGNNQTVISNPTALDTLWLDSIANSIKQKRPVFYTGADVTSSGSDARHAFVAEAYNSSNRRIKFNWGWGGSGDGYFNVITASLNAAGYYFTSEHCAIVGITPPADSLQNAGIDDVVTDQVVINPIYPNPSRTWVSIPYDLGANSQAVMEIFSIDGRKVLSRNVFATDDKVMVNVSDLARGLYVCRINGVTRKFMVE